MPGTPFIRESDVEKAAGAADIVAAVEAVTRAQGLGTAWNQPRQRVRVPGGVLHLMSAAWPDENLLGYKAYTSFKDTVRFYVHGFDVVTGAPVAIAEANRLGQLRTGAATAVAVNHLAAPAPADGSVVTIIGAGFQAWGQIECVAAVRRIAEVRVHSRNAASRDAFAANAVEKLGLRARALASAEEAVRGADVVITATTSSAPVLQGAWITGGALVCGVGANSLSRREIDNATFARAAAVVTDSVEQARLESGALTGALETGRCHLEAIVELAGVVGRGVPARKSASDIVLFLSHGLALWDVASLAALLKKIDPSALPSAFPA